MMERGVASLGGWTNLQVLPGIHNIGPDDIVILKFKGDNPTFYRARIWMTRQRFIDTERFEFR
jgi:hypothetical protein